MKKRFYLYTSWQDSISLLSTEEQAQMLHNFFNYAKGEEPVLNTPGLKLVWAGISYLLKEDSRKYDERVQIARNANKLRHVKKDTLTYDNDNDNVNVNVNVNENDKVNVNDKVKVKVNDKVKVNVDWDNFGK